MKIIGITGPSGSGKTLLTEYFSKNGVPTIDADKLYHSLLTPPSTLLTALRENFGDKIFLPDGSLERRALAQLVFSSSEKLSLLNATVLPTVIEQILHEVAELERRGFSTVAVDAPTLFESGFDAHCDTVITVISDQSTRVRRICERDGISEERALERVRAQKDDGFYTEKSDIVLTNNGSAEELLAAAESSLKHIL